MAADSHAITDLTIVGGGPAGLFGAFYAGLRRMTVRVMDSLGILGGQLTTLYPEKYIYDVAGFPRVLAKDLARHLIDQALQFEPIVSLGQQVHELLYDEAQRIYSITSQQGEHRSRTILIAAGIGSFQPRRLELAGIERFEGRQLHYFVHDLSVFAGTRVLIVGGGDSAVDWANTLEPIAASVTLIHRRDKFRAHEDSVAKLMAGRCRVLTFHELNALHGDERLVAATLYDTRSSTKEMVDVDHILVNIGFQNTLGPIADWGLDLEGNAIKVDTTMRTNRPGIFAAGDIVTYEGKLKLIATGFAEACTAVNYAKTYIDPTARAFPGHSSDK